MDVAAAADAGVIEKNVVEIAFDISENNPCDNRATGLDSVGCPSNLGVDSSMWRAII